MSDDELKVTRRRFMQHTAIATAASATFYSIAMKTDADAQTTTGPSERDGNTVIPYQYDHD